jgi:hypothetical protein
MSESGRHAQDPTPRTGLADLVREAVDDGANSVEEIHRAIADMPLEVLERLDLFREAVRDVRRIQDASIGAIYDVIRRVNEEVTRLAHELGDVASQGVSESGKGTPQGTSS